MAKEWENHKYYARVPLKNPKKNGPKYRYFYTKDEYTAYTNNQQQTKTDDKKNNVLTNLQKSISSGVNKIKKTIGDAKKAIGDALDKIGSKTTEQVQAIATKGKKAVDELLNRESQDQHDTNTMTKTNRFTSKIDDAINEANKNKVDLKDPSAANAIAEKIKMYTNDASGWLLKKQNLPKKTGEWSSEEDMSVINQGRWLDGNREYASNGNCSYCTAAYDLRKRGYDVQACMVRNSDDVTYTDEVASWYKNAKISSKYDIVKRQREKEQNFIDKLFGNPVSSTTSSREEYTEYLEQDMLDQGEGSYGHMFINWDVGSGHDVVWEVVNNEVVIRDCQTNKTHSLYDYIDRGEIVGYIRTDNLELNDEIFKTVVERKSDRKKR